MEYPAGFVGICSAARDLQRLAASVAATACGEERFGPVRMAWVKWSSVRQDLDGGAVEMVDRDHLCTASRRFERAMLPHPS